VTGPVVAALIAAGFVAAADWIAVAREDRLFEGIAKPGVIFCLFVAVLLAGPGVSPVRWLLIVALASSLAGDWLLLPPGQFVAGLVAFLVAHLAYLGVVLPLVILIYRRPDWISQAASRIRGLLGAKGPAPPSAGDE